MSETWIDWRVILERDMQRPGFQESYEAAKRKIDAEEIAGKFLNWEDFFTEEGNTKSAKRRQISLLKVRKFAKAKRSASLFARTRTKKAAQI